MPVFAIPGHERTDELETDNEDEKNGAQNFACAALREPPFDPGENHTGQKNVEYREYKKNESGPEEEAGLSNADANSQTEQPETTYDGGRVQRSVHQTD